MSDATPSRTYESATARIEEIIRRLDSSEAGLRETLDLCREGRSLVEFCAGELEAVGQGLDELRLEELVARLEADRRPSATPTPAPTGDPSPTAAVTGPGGRDDLPEPGL